MIDNKQESQLLRMWSREINLLTDRWIVDNHDPEFYILSFGGGVQTVALLLQIAPFFSNNPKAYVVFADTGNEHPETYEYIGEYVIPFCLKNNINFEIVYNKYDKTLYDYCFDKRIVPSIKFRDCTSKFKIAPIRRYIRETLGLTRENVGYMFIGISYDEADRMNPSNVKYAKNVYPFIDGYKEYFEDGKLTRNDCYDIIKSHGWSVPPKSGCIMCPFSSSADLLDPRYVEMNIRLEENNSRFPEIKLRGMGKSVKTVRELSTSDEANDQCRSGFCFV